MSTRVDQNRHPNRYEIDTAAAPAGQSSTAATSAKKQPGVAESPLGAGASSLVNRYEAAKRGGPAHAQQERIDAARAKLGKLASELPGHGIDLDAFARQFGAAKYSGFSKQRVAGAATFAFMRAALTQHPELAGRAVGLRTRGLPTTDRAIVQLALARSGATGNTKYAECERVIRELAPFDAEQRKDIVGLMRAGASFNSAVAEETQTLAKLAKEPAPRRVGPGVPLATQRRESIESARATDTKWKKVSHHMNVAIRSVPSLSRSAEVAVGAGAGAGSVGSLGWNAGKSLVTGDISHFEHAVDEAERAGSYVAGELSSKIAQADQLYLRFSKQHAEYAEQSQRYQRAIQNGDHDTVTATAARMKTLTREMASTVKAFDAVAEKVGKMSSEFDAAAAHAAAHLALSAVSAGLPGHPIHGLGEAVGHGAKHAVQEAAIIDSAGKLAHSAMRRSGELTSDSSSR